MLRWGLRKSRWGKETFEKSDLALNDRRLVCEARFIEKGTRAKKSIKTTVSVILSGRKSLRDNVEKRGGEKTLGSRGGKKGTI